MAGTKTLVIMAFWHTQRQVEREAWFRGWVFLFAPTRWFRRAEALSFGCPAPKEASSMFVEEKM